eukprot:13236234-Heterocapsa_arctica.AAC.1
MPPSDLLLSPFARAILHPPVSHLVQEPGVDNPAWDTSPPPAAQVLEAPSLPLEEHRPPVAPTQPTPLSTYAP